MGVDGKSHHPSPPVHFLECLCPGTYGLFERFPNIRDIWLMQIILNWHRIEHAQLPVPIEVIICLEAMVVTLDIQARLGRHSSGTCTHFLMKLYSTLHCSLQYAQPRAGKAAVYEIKKIKTVHTQ